VTAGDAERVLALVAAYAAVSVLSWLAFLLHGYDPLDALFEVTSALGTVGLSTGITSSGLEGVLKGVLCLDMLAGRVEFIAILVTLAPRTWLGRREA
jgi:trk system potassium uptake protein TrkH